MAITTAPMQGIMGRRIMGGMFAGDATPSMPAGAVGIWRASEYDATEHPYIPNALAPAQPVNILSLAGRLFQQNMWDKSSCTATDNYANDSDGKMQASRLLCVGNWYLTLGFLGDAPAGTYTAVLEVKRNTGSDQQFCFSATGVATRSPVKTATSAWTRQTYTFTKGSDWALYNLSICSIDGVTDADLLIRRFELFHGSSDLGASAETGQMVMGSSAYSHQPSCVGGELDLTGNDFGLIQFADEYSLTECTVLAVVSKVAAGGAYQSVFSKVQNYENLSLMTEQDGDSPALYLNGGGVMTYPGFWKLRDIGYNMVSIRGDASDRQLWFNKMPMHRLSSGMGTVTLRDAWVGLVVGLGLYSGCKLQWMAFYDRKLTDQEMADAYDVAVTEITAPITQPARFHFTEGDSIVSVPNSYAFAYQATADADIFGANLSKSGSALTGAAPNHLIGRGPVADAIIAGRASPAQTCVLSVLIGANDLYNYSSALDYAADLAAYCDDRRAAGFKVVVCTILPSAVPVVGAIHNTRRAIVNAQITSSWLGVHCDAIADFAADPDMGTDAAASDTALYPDGLHPSTLGYSYLTPIYTAAVDSCW